MFQKYEDSFAEVEQVIAEKIFRKLFDSRDGVKMMADMA